MSSNSELTEKKKKVRLPDQNPKYKHFSIHGKDHIYNLAYCYPSKKLCSRTWIVMIIKNRKAYTPVFLKISFKNFLHQKHLECILEKAIPKASKQKSLGTKVINLNFY